MKIPVFDLELFLQATGASMDCPFCRCVDWKVEVDVFDDDKRYFIVSELPAREPERKMTFVRHAIIATCAQCSFMRFLDAEAVSAWQTENQP